MGNADQELFPSTPFERSRIPESIRLHPKLDQATKFLWVVLWEQAGWRPNTVNTTPGRLAGAVGASERSVIRWLDKLVKAGLIELVDRPKRGEWLYYLNPLKGWENTLGIPTAKISIGTSVTDLPVQSGEVGKSVPDPPIHSEPKIIPQEISESEASQLASLARDIDRKRSEMPRSAFGISGDGTALADCKRQRSLNSPETVDSLRKANPAPVLSDSRSDPPISPPLPPVGSPVAPAVIAAVNRLAERIQPADDFNTVYDWLRTEFPDDQDVYPQLLRRIATAIVTGKMEKAALSEIVENSKAPRILCRSKWFCATMGKILPKVKTK